MGADDKKVAKVGEYEVLVKGAPVAFWPLDTAAATTAPKVPIICAPNSEANNNLAVLPLYGTFDVVIRMSEDVVPEKVDPLQLRDVACGKATLKKVALIRADSGEVRIKFAVDHSKLAKAGTWEGTLRLKAPYAANKNSTLELPIKVAHLGSESRLFVFFIVHKKPKKTYAWMTLKALEASTAAPALTGAEVDLKILRDNLAGSGFAGINRRVKLTTGSKGQVGLGETRDRVGVPIDWPLIVTVTKSGSLRRAHLIQLDDAAAKKDNLVPHDAGSIRVSPMTNVSLAGKKFLLDPGHGVVYGLAKARRSQEWFAAHRLAEEISRLLTTNHGVLPADILWTRTAGFGLIDPASVHQNGAPEAGNARYKLDLPKMRITVKGTTELHDLCSLLRTRHQGADDAAVSLSEVERNQFLKDNAATVAAVVARLNASLAPAKHRVRAGSPRWSPTLKKYIYTEEKVSNADVVNDHAPFAIRTGDWFALDTLACTALADRSARWSLACEIGSGPNADGARPAFSTAARKTMADLGAVDYMRERILRYLQVTAPHAYLDEGPMAWGPTDRAKYFNKEGAGCDLVLSLHNNAGGGKGGMVLVSHKAGVDAPPKDQIRLAKVMAKYLDAFDQGLRQAGVTTDLPANPAGMLYHGNQMREHYLYFETEFMDAIDPKDPIRYSYQEMASMPCATRVAGQIVAGMVEVLLEPQADIDSVKHKASAALGGLW